MHMSSLRSVSFGSEEVAVVLVFAAACLLLFFDLGVIAKARASSAPRGGSGEGFVLEAQSTARSGDFAEEGWRKAIEEAFLDSLGRFPSLSETRTFLSFLASERALRGGGEIADPQKEVAGLLRNTHDYRAGEIAGYLMTGNNDAARRAASITVKNFTRDYYGLASPLLSEHEARMARVYSAFSTLLNRRPTPRELEYMKKFASSPTRVERAVAVLKRQGEKADDTTKKKRRSSASFSLTDAESIAVKDQQDISDVYREVHRTRPPLYIPALLRDAYVRDYNRDKTALKKHLVDMRERARDGRCLTEETATEKRKARDAATSPGKDPSPLVTPNSFTSISVPHARVGQGENFDGFIVSNAELDADSRWRSASDRLDAWGALQLERQALVADTQDTIPESPAVLTERRMLTGSREF